MPPLLAGGAGCGAARVYGGHGAVTGSQALSIQGHVARGCSTWLSRGEKEKSEFVTLDCEGELMSKMAESPPCFGGEPEMMRLL